MHGELEEDSASLRRGCRLDGVGSEWDQVAGIRVNKRERSKGL